MLFSDVGGGSFPYLFCFDFSNFGTQFFNNVNSMFKPFGHDSGWAGGVTQSGKNTQSN